MLVNTNSEWVGRSVGQSEDLCLIFSLMNYDRKRFPWISHLLSGLLFECHHGLSCPFARLEFVIINGLAGGLAD